VLLAHQMAIESDLIRGDMVEVIEFPHLATRYQVMGVPRTVINETIHIEGAVPEPMLMAEFAKVLNPKQAEKPEKKVGGKTDPVK
jgi:predicted DsbA family dithiol-disulfide isomerase